MFNGRRRRRADKVNDVKYTTNSANYIQTEQTFNPVSTTRVPTSGSPNLQCWNLGWYHVWKAWITYSPYKKTMYKIKALEQTKARSYLEVSYFVLQIYLGL